MTDTSHRSAMTTASQPGFPQRGSTYYVFALGSSIPATASPAGEGAQPTSATEGGKHR